MSGVPVLLNVSFGYVVMIVGLNLCSSMSVEATMIVRSIVCGEFRDKLSKSDLYSNAV
jgi:hypothetical protein